VAALEIRTPASISYRNLATLYNPAVQAAPERLCAQINALLTELGAAPLCSPERLARMLANPHAQVVLALVGEKVVGMATVSVAAELDATEAWIENVIVTESYRRRGILRTLIDHCIVFARKHGADSIELNSGADRCEAHLAYEALGFKKQAAYSFWRFTESTL
jgi:GNAT superfamily N-acetyltransferase